MAVFWEILGSLKGKLQFLESFGIIVINLVASNDCPSRPAKANVTERFYEQIIQDSPRKIGQLLL